MNFKVKFKEETPPFNVKFGWDNGEFEAGKQEEYDRFWDIVQRRGLRIDYIKAFYQWDWEYANPKYKIKPTSANEIFCHNVNIKKIDESKFDFSDCDSAYRAFYNCNNLEHIPDLNLAPKQYDQTFLYCYILKTIAVLDFSNCIANCRMLFEGLNSLENISEIKGYISVEGVNLRWSTKLNKATIVRIVNALSLDTNGLTVTFSQTAKNNAFTDAEWAELIGTKPNWTFSLA